MVESSKPASSAKTSSPEPAKALPPSAPASRTIHRNTETGRIANADAVAANPKGHAAEALEPNYTATVVNVVKRATGVRVTVDLDLPAEQADVLTMDGAKFRFGISV